MSPESIRSVLEQVSAGQLTPHQAMEELATLPFAEMEHSTLDTHRELRQGLPEIVFGENKTAAQIADNLRRLHQAHGRALATRVEAPKAQDVLSLLPEASHHPTARCLTVGLRSCEQAPSSPFVALACAGTSDLPVMEEAALTLEFLGHPIVRLQDVGVAGLHRLLSHLDTLRRAHLVISVAGMEGALTSVIGGLVSCPVIGVPTSVGYGVAREGQAALQSMLSSCASGVAVVNIDNGFGAAVFAHTVLSLKQSS